MRQKSKRFILMLCVLACFAFLTACGSQNADTSRYSVNPELADSISWVTENLLEEISAFSKEDAPYVEEELRDQRQDVLADGVAEWATVTDDTGPYVRALSSQVVMEDADNYTCTVYAEYANRNLEFKIYYTYDSATQGLMPTAMSFTPEYTLGEKIQKAFMNMVMGMGLVFVILIFLSLLISCFRFISVAQGRFKKEESRIPEGTGASVAHADTAVVRRSSAPKPAAAQPDISPDEVLIPGKDIAEEPIMGEVPDDLELVAVIAAAIAASENIPADGLRVRSIRRVSGSKWKNQ